MRRNTKGSEYKREVQRLSDVMARRQSLNRAIQGGFLYAYTNMKAPIHPHVHTPMTQRVSELNLYLSSSHR